MKNVLFALLTIFVVSGLQAQEATVKLPKSEAKELMNSLTAEEKAKLLSQLLLDDERLVNKTLKKALKKANKNHVDAFMKRKDMVFTPIERKDRENTVQEKAKKVVKAEQSKLEAKPKVATPVVVEKGHEGHNHAPGEGHGDKSKSTDTKAKQAPSYVMKDKTTGAMTTIAFDDTTFDYGTIKDGESVTHTYKFTNTGTEPYIISNAKGSCGCTVPVWSREPILPGESSEIVVTFNSRGKGKVGGQNQSKRVTLTGNTNPANTYLTIKGIVTKDQ